MTSRVEEFPDPATGEILYRVGERELTPIDVIVCARCPVFLDGTSTEGAMCAPCQIATHEETIIDLEKRLADALLYLDDMAHEVEIARQNLTQRGGQHVPYFGDYCNVGPNALSRIEYNVHELRRRLGEKP